MKTHHIFTAVILTAVIFNACDLRKKEDQSGMLSEKVKLKDTTTVEILDSVYNFDKVKEGDMVEHNYRFKNTGNKPLTIFSAQASCGCTVPEKPDQPILPGAIGYIKVKFNSDKRPGEAEKTITVTSNAIPEFPPLILKGTVIGKTE